MLPAKRPGRQLITMAIWLAVAAPLLGLPQFSARADPLRSAPVRVLAATTWPGGCANPCYDVIHDAQRWERFWHRVMVGSPPPVAPQVDFSREVVIVVGWGEVPSSGYRIEVERTLRVRDLLEVFVRRTTPNGNVMFHPERPQEVVAVPRPVNQVEFIVQTQQYSCPTDLWASCGDPRGAPVVSGGRCANPPSPARYRATCYPAARIIQAERRLPASPVNPSKTVSRLTHLLLRRLIVLGRDTPDRSAFHVHAIEYLYGAAPPPLDRLVTKKQPSFVNVIEYDRSIDFVGTDLGLTSAPRRPLVEQSLVHTGTTSESPGMIYDGPWEWRGYSPKRHLWLIVMADARRSLVQHLGMSVLRAVDRG